jgi:hypothetical protein
LIAKDTIMPFLDAIIHNFVSCRGEVSLSPGLQAEPFIDIFCSFSELIERFDLQFHRELIDEIIGDDQIFLNQYATFLRIRKSRSQILRILKRDDSAAFRQLIDSDIEQEVLQLFGIKTSAVKPVAAALCGAKFCLGAHRPAIPEFMQAVVWGGFQWASRTFSPEDVTRYGIQYHRYNFPLQPQEWAASFAIENRNLIALTKLSMSGVKITREMLHQAIELHEVELISFIMSRVVPTKVELELAIRTGDARVVLMLIVTGHIDANEPLAEDGTTALHLAAALDLIKVALVLLSVPGIFVDPVDSNGEKPVDIAERIGATELVQLIQQFKESSNAFES